MAIISQIPAKKPMWQAAVLFTLMFWLSGSLILDTVVMPVLYTSGMMGDSGFAAAGYSLFWVFNRVELLCAAVVLTGILIRYRLLNTESRLDQKPIFLAAILLMVALVYTYGLSPQMSSLGLQLNLFDAPEETPVLMNSLHVGYWLLELLKLFVGAILVRTCMNSSDKDLVIH
jgi:hypothetical protein